MKDLQAIKCFMFDLDGTVYLSDRLLPKAKETLAFLKTRAKVMYLTNNASVSRKKYVLRLRRLGIDADINDIYTSATATVDYIKEHMPRKKAYVFGTDDLRQEIEESGVRTDDENPDLIVLGFKTDMNFDDLSKVCTAVKKGVPYLATHGDPFCPVDGGIIPDVGAFVSLVRTATGREPLCICGKPYEPMAARSAPAE